MQSPENKEDPEPCERGAQWRGALRTSPPSLPPLRVSPWHQLWLLLMNSLNSRLGNRPRNPKFYNDWRSFGPSSRELYDAKIELVHFIPKVCG